MSVLSSPAVLNSLSKSFDYADCLSKSSGDIFSFIKSSNDISTLFSLSFNSFLSKSNFFSRSYPKSLLRHFCIGFDELSFLWSFVLKSFLLTLFLLIFMLLNKSSFSLWPVFNRLFYSFSVVDFFLIGSSVFYFVYSVAIYDSSDSFFKQSLGSFSDTFSNFYFVCFLSLPFYYFNDLSYLGTLESIFFLSFESR